MSECEDLISIRLMLFPPFYKWNGNNYCANFTAPNAQ